jgi:hypothetical protein
VTGRAERATVKTSNGAESSVRRESGPATSRVRENTSKGPAKSRTSTPSKIRIPTFDFVMAQISPARSTFNPRVFAAV